MVPVGELVRDGATVTYGSDWDNVPEPNAWEGVEKIIDTKVERTVLKGKTVYPQK
jgi:predicted amidohydrolase YtcJ